MSPIRAAVPGLTATPHDLRHYFASAQIRGGQSIKVLQALLGHKSAMETWDTYGHLMGDEDPRSREVMDELLGERHVLRAVEGSAVEDPRDGGAIQPQAR